ncbi:MAG: serine hydrolase domain-containing protein [Chloroflexota bacterium]|jgi:CubicO group peptidase (beta-lactamase class C family)
MRLGIVTICLALVLSACGSRDLVLYSGGDPNNIPVLPTVTPDGNELTEFFRPQVTPTPVAFQVLPSDDDTLVLDPVEVGSVGEDNVLGQHMQSLSAAGLFSGSILVARRGEILLRHGYGMSTDSIVATSTTRYRIASLSKQFTAALILRLYEQQRIDLEASICNYLDDCPAAWAGINVRHLLAHNSGIPDYTDFRDFDPRQATPTNRAELISRFRNQPLIFAPGSSYRYSNSGYVLLGQIIENVTGQPYDVVLFNEITGPLGLNDTGYDKSINGSDPRLAKGYHSKGRNTDAIDSSTLDAAGGMYSTIDDLFRWDRALIEGRMLRSETLAMMRTPQLKNYGFGVMLNPLAGMSSVHHDGMASGIRTYLGNFTDNDICVIVLSNYEAADVVNIAVYLAQLATGMP